MGDREGGVREERNFGRNSNGGEPWNNNYVVAFQGLPLSQLNYLPFSWAFLFSTYLYMSSFTSV